MIGHLSVFMRHRAARATGFVFASAGLVLGSWAALIPFIKGKFSLDEAELGLLLLSLPAGVMLSNPLSVPVLNRFGAVKSTMAALALTGLLFILPFGMPFIWLTALTLFAAGSAFACTNVSMNTCATLLEHKTGVRIMSTCHGLWSAGMMTGSVLAGLAVGRGIPPVWYFSVVGLFECFIAIFLYASLKEVPDDVPQPVVSIKKSPAFIFPNKALWVLIIISSCANLTEGAMADWSAVYMKEIVQAPATMAGWGFTVYAFFMAGGRFMGDELTGRFSSRAVLKAGGLTVALGLTIVIAVPGTAPALAGFALAGAGVSLSAPILYAAAAKVPGMAKGAGLATMNTFAMVSFLGGPAVIGFIAKIFSLQLAFAMVAVFAVIWAWQAGKIR